MWVEEGKDWKIKMSLVCFQYCNVYILYIVMCKFVSYLKFFWTHSLSLSLLLSHLMNPFFLSFFLSLCIFYSFIHSFLLFFYFFLPSFLPSFLPCLLFSFSLYFFCQSFIHSFISLIPLFLLHFFLSFFLSFFLCVSHTHRQTKLLFWAYIFACKENSLKVQHMVSTCDWTNVVVC